MTKKRAKNRHQPSIVVSNPSEEPVDPNVIRDLGIRCLLKTNLDGIQPSKGVFTIENVQGIKRWLFIYVPALSNADLESVEAATQQFGEPLPILARRSRYVLEAPLTEFCRCRLSKMGRRKQKQDENKQLVLSDLVHDQHLLGFMGYPDTGVKLDTKPGTGQAFSLDCEMCLAGSKRVLTRIAVVNFDSEEVLLDTLVKPTEPITDYVTQFSGIKPEMMESVVTDLRDVQQWLQQNVGSSDILIGHSLESDLKVLEVTHDKCVDTALVYPHHKGLPMRSSLKYLTKKFLNLDIQGPTTADKPGHDPIEDSLACVKLIKSKLENGLDYGDTSGTITLTKFLSDHDMKSTIVDQGVPYWDAHGTGNVICVSDDVESVEKSLKALEGSEFVFTTLNDPVLTKVGTSMSTLVTDAPAQTLVTIWNGMGDLGKVRELLAKRQRTRTEYRTKKWDEIEDPWTDADEQCLAEAENAARRGLAYVTLTGNRQVYETDSSGESLSDTPRRKTHNDAHTTSASEVNEQES